MAREDLDLFWWGWLGVSGRSSGSTLGGGGGGGGGSGGFPGGKRVVVIVGVGNDEHSGVHTASLYLFSRGATLRTATSIVSPAFPFSGDFRLIK